MKASLSWFNKLFSQIWRFIWVLALLLGLIFVFCNFSEPIHIEIHKPNGEQDQTKKEADRKKRDDRYKQQKNTPKDDGSKYKDMT